MVRMGIVDLVLMTSVRLASIVIIRFALVVDLRLKEVIREI